ncbi:uncharacterized protein LOC119725642 [Patiria miniata]|uniref:Protein sleepless n=1 Tax=Patiria miniata TaxID=46514 RepID=A0A913ZPJ6_PATMI|nr:uncharacterized protein LOC119725642 [Patiria miniata]
MQGLLLSLLTLSMCVAGSYAVQCYECNGVIQPLTSNTWCSDPFDADSAGAKASIKSCKGPCVKLYSKIGSNVEGYVRQCSNDTDQSLCINDCGSVGDIYSCGYCCTGDLCNSAASVTFNLLAAVAMLVSAWVFTA